jgi:addiction module RelB/DinJ family antitoxin
MSKTVLNIKVDSDVKERSREVAKDLGLPLSTVVNAYLKEFIRDREVRFSAAPRLRPEVEKELRERIDDMDAGRNIVGPFTSAKEAIAYLESEGI